MRPIRLTAVLTHPVQYDSPWFRHVAAYAPEIELTVLYGTEPTAEQQGTGFGRSFRWDVPLLEGYRSRVIRAARPGDRTHSSSFFGLDVPEVGNAIRETNPDVVLVPGWHSITLMRAIFAARRMNVPLLFRGDTNLGSEPEGWRGRVWRFRTKRLLALFDAYLAPGRRVREYLETLNVNPGQIVDVPHVVDNERFAAAARPFQSADGRARARGRWQLPSDASVLLFAGKLEEKKRPLDLIRAAARLDPRAHVLVAGAGELESACRAEAGRLGVPVAFAGFLNQSAIAEAYAAADLLVLPSDSRETWGLVVNEALATGLPVVVSDRVGCAPDLVDDSTGATFVCGDLESLAAMIEQVRSRAATGDYAAGCRRRSRQFDVNVATAGLVAACRRVAGAGVDEELTASAIEQVGAPGEVAR